MLVKLKHGTCIYKGTTYTKGQELEVSELFFKTNSTRFEAVEPEVKEVRNVKPKRRKKSTEGGEDI